MILIHTLSQSKLRFFKLFICVLIATQTSCTELNGQTLYVSSTEGSDQNNGLSENTPLKTLSAAFDKGANNTILLKAGDVFFREMTYVLNRKLGKYGEGVNPTLCGYKRIINPDWEKVSKNIWRISLVRRNYSGVQVKGSSFSNNIGCIHEYDKDIIHGRKCQYLRDLKEDWDIWQTERTGSKTPKEAYDSLYLYYSGNPNNLKLEFSTGQIAVTIRDGVLENINVVGYGFGVSAGSNVVISGCHIDAIGGRTLITSKNFVCDGNGIGIWIYEDKDTENTTVEDCYISRVYDSGVCLSGSDGFKTTARNIVVKNNLIANCCQGWEDFLRNDPPKYYENCVFENNIVVFSGESGFGYPASRFKYCHVLSNNYKGDKKMIFRNNTFIGGNFHCNGGFQGTYTTNVWENNTCYLNDENYLMGNYSGTKDVVRFGTSKKAAIEHYRNLTEDSSTKFIVRSKSSVTRRGKRAIANYLKTHTY